MLQKFLKKSLLMKIELLENAKFVKNKKTYLKMLKKFLRKSLLMKIRNKPKITV